MATAAPCAVPQHDIHHVHVARRKEGRQPHQLRVPSQAGPEEEALRREALTISLHKGTGIPVGGVVHGGEDKGRMGSFCGLDEDVETRATIGTCSQGLQVRCAPPSARAAHSRLVDQEKVAAKVQQFQEAEAMEKQRRAEKAAQLRSAHQPSPAPLPRARCALGQGPEALSGGALGRVERRGVGAAAEDPGETTAGSEAD